MKRKVIALLLVIILSLATASPAFASIPTASVGDTVSVTLDKSGYETVSFTRHYTSGASIYWQSANTSIAKCENATYDLLTSSSSYLFQCDIVGVNAGTTQVVARDAITNDVLLTVSVTVSSYNATVCLNQPFSVTLSTKLAGGFSATCNSSYFSGATLTKYSSQGVNGNYTYYYTYNMSINDIGDFNIVFTNNNGGGTLDYLVNVNEHAWNSGNVTTQPTCTDYGRIDYQCLRCSTTGYNTYGSPLGHEFSTDWTVDSEPTCSVEGSTSHHCIRCDEKSDITPIAMSDHVWDNGTISLEPTCTEDGEKIYVCSVCSASKNESIPAFGHTFQEAWDIDIWPTNDIDGSKSHHCLVCEAKDDITVIPAVPLTELVLTDSVTITYSNPQESLNVAFIPADTTANKKIIWSSSNPEIAEVDENGIVRGISNGTAIIYATSADTGIQASCNVVVNIEAPLNDVQKFVSRLYENILQREADTAGLNAWANVLTSGQEQGAKVAQGFLESEEFKQRTTLSDTDYMYILYRTFLDREPDDQGLNAWLNVLDSGLSRMHVFKGFAESAEFTALCSQYGITRGNADLTAPMDQNEGVTKFVARCYNLCLGRKGDTDGVNSWCQQILSGSNTAKQVAYGFIFSSEFAAKELFNTEYVKILYQVFMDREADASGLNAWVNVLESGKSREHVFNGFADSVEFRNICNSYGIN